MLFSQIDPIQLGGKNPSLWGVVVSDSWADLHSFFKTYHGSFAGLTDLEKDFLKTRPDSARDKGWFARNDKLTREKAICLNLNVPHRGAEMYKSKAPLRVLVPWRWCEWLEEIGVCPVPRRYIPVLMMILKSQYVSFSGVGKTPEMEAFYTREIRGKLIDLLRSGEWVDEPDHPSLEKLNQQLENIDLGRRSDLKFSSRQEEGSLDATDKFTPKTISEASRTSPQSAHVKNSEELTKGASGLSFRDFQRQ